MRRPSRVSPLSSPSSHAPNVAPNPLAGPSRPAARARRVGGVRRARPGPGAVASGAQGRRARHAARAARGRLRRADGPGRRQRAGHGRGPAGRRAVPRLPGRGGARAGGAHPGQRHARRHAGDGVLRQERPLVRHLRRLRDGRVRGVRGAARQRGCGGRGRGPHRVPARRHAGVPWPARAGRPPGHACPRAPHARGPERRGPRGGRRRRVRAGASGRPGVRGVEGRRGRAAPACPRARHPRAGGDPASRRPPARRSPPRRRPWCS